MKTHFNLFCLTENKFIFQNRFDLNEEINLNSFHIKMITESSFLIIENDRKTIFLLNEIFTVNYFDYLLTSSNENISLLSYGTLSGKIFNELCYVGYFKYCYKLFFKIHKFKISLKHSNLYYFKFILLIIFVIIYFSRTDFISNEYILDTKKFQNVKSIYMSLNEIYNKSNEVYKIIPKINKSENQSIVSTPLKSDHFQKKLSTPKIHDVQIISPQRKDTDHDIQYFLDLKKSSRSNPD